MKVLILAGGFGTRLSEETGIKPKPMVEIGGKPILWHILKTYAHYGFNEFVVLLGYKGYMIKEYFANYFLHNSSVTFDLKNNSMEVLQNNSSDWKVTLLDTGADSMTGNRIKQAEKYVNGEDFLLTYGDGLSNVNIADVVKYHNSHDGIITLTAVQHEEKYGLITLGDNDTKVTTFHEKPKGGQGWINGGFFVCSNEVFKYISNDANCIFEKKPLESISNDGKLFAFKHRDFWQAMDSLKDKNTLEYLWETNKAQWKVWKD